MSCLRQSVSFHRIAHETGLRGLFLALSIGTTATRAQFSPQIHAEIPEMRVAVTAPSQLCLPHVPTSLPCTRDHTAAHPNPAQKVPANWTTSSSHCTTEILHLSSSYTTKSHPKTKVESHTCIPADAHKVAGSFLLERQARGPLRGWASLHLAASRRLPVGTRHSPSWGKLLNQICIF